MKISMKNGVISEDLSTKIMNWNELDGRYKLLCADRNLGFITIERDKAHRK